MRIRTQLLCSIACLAPSLAYAGAWTQDQGKAQVILTGSYYNADQLWNNHGNKQSQPTYSKYELNPYLEYGLRDDLTIGTSLSLQRLHQDGNHSPGASSWGVGDSEFFLRKRLWKQDGFVASVEPMIKLPSPESSGLQPRIGSSDADAGLGLSGGYGFSAYGQNHFADVDTQYRHRFGGPNDQVKISGTLGVGITPSWMIMPQSFMTYRTGHDANAAFTQSSGDDYNLLRLQLSAVYKMSDDLSFQFGGFKDVDGKNAGVGNGALLAVWKRL